MKKIQENLKIVGRHSWEYCKKIEPNQLLKFN